jgi:hypothetical protein
LDKCADFTVLFKIDDEEDWKKVSLHDEQVFVSCLIYKRGMMIRKEKD